MPERDPVASPHVGDRWKTGPDSFAVVERAHSQSITIVTNDGRRIDLNAGVWSAWTDGCQQFGGCSPVGE